MAKKNNGEFELQSTGSKPGIHYSDSTESIVNSENRKSGCNSGNLFTAALDTVNHILIVLVTACLVYVFAKDYHFTNSVYSIHIILCTIGYVLLMSEAIVVLAGDNILTGSLSRRANKHLHWILQALGLILNVIGVVIIYIVRKRHFLSIHAITGITSLVIVCVVTIFGYPVWIAWKLRKFMRPVITKFLHNFLGTAGFVIGIVSQCYGYKKNMVSRTTEIKHADDALLILTVLIMILSMRSSLPTLYRQAVDSLKSICSSISQ